MRPLPKVTAALEAVWDDGTVPSLLYSLALHGVLAWLVLYLMAHGRPVLPPAPPTAVFADLVPLAENTVSPNAAANAAIPQDRAQETGRPDATAIPIPTDRRAPALRDHAENAPRPAAPTRSGEAEARRTPSSGEAQNATGGDLQTRLEALAQLRQPASRLPLDPRTQAGEGTSNAIAANDAARRGAHASYGVKDFIRAQIARHWYLDRGSKAFAQAQSQGWIVSLHLVLNADGTVAHADVDIPSAQAHNQAFQTFAYSARNAALLSAPLEIPPGTYDEVKDVMLDFTANDAAR